MKRNLIFIVIIVILIVGVAGTFVYKNLTKKEKAPGENTMSKSDKQLYGKRVAMIIAFRDFRDAEYFVQKEILEEAGADVVTVSTKIATAIGADGGDTKVDLLIDDVKANSFDAIVFIGGPGALEYLDNDKLYNLAKEAVKENRVLAAICISSVILAKAGVLSGKQATVWSSSMDKQPIRILEANGATYKDVLVVADEKIITGNGPEAAAEFGKALVEALTKEPERIE